VSAATTEVLRDTLQLLDQKQRMVDCLVRLIEASDPALLDEDLRAEIQRQSVENGHLIARVQEAFLD
jgi:hypothetical protein